MIRTLSISLLALSACTTDTDDTDPDISVDQTIVDIASADAQFSTLVSAIEDAGLMDTLSGDGNFTVFAPTDDAFAALGVDLSTLSTDELASILTYHVIAEAEVDSASIPALADSAAGYTLFFDTSDGVMVNNATVTNADIDASNGIIHVVDTVLMPPTILDAAGYAGLTSLAGAVEGADPAIANLLGSPGEYTVFAPTNDAFDDVSDVTAGLDATQLADVLAYHAFPGSVTSDAVPALADSLMENAYGINVTALFDTSDGVAINGADVVVADIYTTNGVVHVIDEVLLPPTVVDLASVAGLTSLLDTVGAASGDLGTTLSGEGPFTVFAPTNDAFDDIASVASTLSADELRDILLFHVVGGDYPVKSADLTAGEVPTLLADTSVTVDLTAGVVVENANVVIADVHGTNGTVHVIDAVMLP